MIKTPRRGGADRRSFCCMYLLFICMKNRTIIIASFALFTACNNAANNNGTPNDSLGNKFTDTTGRSDTAYYERLQQKTGAEDTTSSGTPRRSDTGYYERLPNKTNPPDSGQ